MKKSTVFFICLVLLLAMGCNEQPTPNHPVTYTGIPHDIVKVTGRWKMGEFVVGYRIVTDEYIVISGAGGLFGQEGQSFGGPGTVPYSTVSTFGSIAKIAEQVKDKSPITFFGDLAYSRNGNQPYLFEGKKVIILLNATYNGQDYEVNRRPWDN